MLCARRTQIWIRNCPHLHCNQWIRHHHRSAFETNILLFANFYGKNWNTGDMDVMDSRLETFLAMNAINTSSQLADEEVQVAGHTKITSVPVCGWRILDHNSNWKPCPIGVYVWTDLLIIPHNKAVIVIVYSCERVSKLASALPGRSERKACHLSMCA